MTAKAEFTSGKIRKLREEGYPPKQAVAIALSYARKKGYDVGKKPGKKEK